MIHKRFQFAPYNSHSKGTCPQCGQRKRLRRYIDIETGQYLPDHVGVCDRIEKCGYKYTWYDYVRDESKEDHVFTSKPHKDFKDKKSDKFSTIPAEIFNRSFNNQLNDALSLYLIKRFGQDKVIPILKTYKIGFAKTWGDKPCTVFWQIDINGNVRSGKIMAYEEKNGDIKRVKGGDRPLINWVHSFYEKEYNLKQCFFGEHLLKVFPKKKVIIVEGEKTAIIGAIFYPKFLWLSSGMLQGINDDKMEPLKDREIILYPDKGEKAFEIWNKKCKIYKKKGYNILVKRIKNAKLADGDDIADLLLTL